MRMALVGSPFCGTQCDELCDALGARGLATVCGLSQFKDVLVNDGTLRHAGLTIAVKGQLQFHLGRQEPHLIRTAATATAATATAANTATQLRG